MLVIEDAEQRSFVTENENISEISFTTSEKLDNIPSEIKKKAVWKILAGLS